ncbi:MAG TPA: SRPBCC domain-containing protein [Solirubrobacteraceae bacterium]|jgi:uncharacterized protein YndB with AHSA1/START domain|nr:SRPBCC domain-containing protein [Solirubrobacteraceae bacterium]
MTDRDMTDRDLSTLGAGGRLTLERFYGASVEDLWDLWTTKAGIESWWGPAGFTVEVHELDLRAGGGLLYTMTATAPEQVRFMQGAGMPLSTRTRITYTEVVEHERLAYETLADFIPGVEPYAMATLVELHPTPEGVRLLLSFDAMHEEQWTRRALAGHESELEKLARVIDARGT